MQPIYNIHRALSITVGAASTGAALWILLQDAFKSGTWTTEHLLTPVLVGVTIVAGHLIWSAMAARKYAAAAGFFALFLAGTALTVYNSVGRQAATAAQTEQQADDIKDRRAERQAARKRSVQMLTEAEGKVATACKNGPDTRSCTGVKATIEVYKAAIEGHDAALKSIGLPVPVAPKASSMANTLAMFGFAKDATRAALVDLERYAYSLFFEMGAIVAFGFAFARSRRPAVSVEPPPAVRQAEAEAVQPIVLADVRRERAALAAPAQRTPAQRAQGLTPAEIKAQDAETLAVIRKARRPLSNRELAQRLGCSEGQASKRWQRVREHLQLGWENKERRISAA